MEVRFVYRPLPPNIHRRIHHKLFQEEGYHYDSRGGLDTIIFGLHHSEILEEGRLLHQLERALGYELKLMDYWDSDMADDFVPIQRWIQFLEGLQEAIQAHPRFHWEIDYQPDHSRYFKGRFKRDVAFLLSVAQAYAEEGVEEVMFVED